MSSEDLYANQAKDLVDNVISMAIKRLETNMSLMSDKEKTFESLKFSEMSRESTLARDDNYVVENISWLSIGEFTLEEAERKIDDFIQVCITEVITVIFQSFHTDWSDKDQTAPRGFHCLCFHRSCITLDDITLR